jgi:hypothetical protein
MTTLVHQDSRGEFQQRTDRTLVSTTAFHNEFYTYTEGKNPSTFAPTGVFSAVAGATSTTCPAGRVLHLTGRKLYPDVNPMTTFVGTALTAKKFLVSVYDPISFLKGFVDPTSNTFAKFDQNLPNFFNLGTAGSGVEWSGGGQGVDIHLVDSGTLAVTAYTSNVATVAAKNASTGLITIAVGIGGAATNTINVTTTAVTTTSRIFISPISLKNTVTDIFVGTPAANGTFTVTVVTSGNIATQVYAFNFLIVN